MAFTGPALGFAPPHASLSASVRERIDQTIATIANDSTKQHLEVHMRKGLDQIEQFMRHAHTDANGMAYTDFATMAAAHSDRWKQHVDHASSDKEMHVSKRRLQSTLQLNMTGYDLKVGRPGRPDDGVYQTSEYARKFMPRGNFIAAWVAPTTGATLYLPLLRAYRKFTGQEDDGEQHGKVGEELLSKFFTKPMRHTKHVISTTKENGEAAHLAVLKRSSDGAYLFVVGSKNTHMVVTSIDDIDRACAAGTCSSGGNPYMAAAPIARALLQMIHTLAPTDRVFVCELLAQTRMTASFEMLSPRYQHVQLLDYLREDMPVFYGLSFPSLDEMEGVEICVNPVLAYELFRAIGVRTVEFKVVPFTDNVMAQTLEEIRMAYQHEGAVNLFLDERACIIGMEKFKTVWYVCLRAIREKAKSYLNRATNPKFANANANTTNNTNTKKKKNKEANSTPGAAMVASEETVQDPLTESKHALRKRFAAIKAYLDLTPEQTEAYLALGTRFVTYLHDVRLAACGDDKDAKKALMQHVATMFPVAWKEFLEHTKLDDRVL